MQSDRTSLAEENLFRASPVIAKLDMNLPKHPTRDLLCPQARGDSRWIALRHNAVTMLCMISRSCPLRAPMKALLLLRAAASTPTAVEFDAHNEA